MVGRQGRAWGSQSLVQATDIRFLASAHLLNTEGRAHVQACLLLREGLDLFSGPSQHAHLLRKPAVPLRKESPGTRPQGSGTWAEIAVMKVEGVQGHRGLLSLVLGHLEEMGAQPGQQHLRSSGQSQAAGPGPLCRCPTQLLACRCLHICEAGMCSVPCLSHWVYPLLNIQQGTSTMCPA